jgi:hypothetical protein
MLSFAELWEQMDSSQNNPLMGSGEETKTSQLIRAGKQLRKEGESSFWDDFLSLLSDSEGLAQLLNISSDKILSWPGRIRDALKKSEKENSDKQNPDEETEMLPTGDNGAIVASNQDPM